MSKRLIFITCLCIVSVQLFAQDSLTLEIYREKVLAYSQVLKQAREQTVASLAQEKFDKTGYLPKIDFAANATLDLAHLEEAWTPPSPEYRNHTYHGDLQVSQPLYAGGAIRSRYRASQIETDMSRLSERLTFENIFYQADAAYWSASAYLQLYQANRQYYDIVKTQHDIIDLRFRDGMISRTDLLMISTRLKEAELQLTSARKSCIVAFQNLNILMGVDPEEPVLLGDAINREIPNPLRLSLSEVLPRRPDYLRSGLDIALQEQYRKLAISQFNPQLGFSLTGGWGSASPNYGLSPDFTGLAALSLKVPVFYWGERKQTDRMNRAYILIKELEHDLMRDRISQELSAAWVDITQSTEQIRIARENLELAQENLDLVTFSYNEGKNPITDVLSAQLSWITAYSNVISSYLSHKMALADYTRAIGSVPAGTEDNLY